MPWSGVDGSFSREQPPFDEWLLGVTFMMHPQFDRAGTWLPRVKVLTSIARIHRN
jgi:hypothetical protein